MDLAKSVRPHTLTRASKAEVYLFLSTKGYASGRRKCTLGEVWPTEASPEESRDEQASPALWGYFWVRVSSGGLSAIPQIFSTLKKPK